MYAASSCNRIPAAEQTPTVAGIPTDVGIPTGAGIPTANWTSTACDPSVSATAGAHGDTRGLGARLRNAALELLSPTRCIGCEKPGELICAECLERIEWIDAATACLACGAPFGSVTCTECRGAPSALAWCLACASYEEPLPSLIRGYKDGGERRLAEVIAEMMAARYLSAWRDAGTRLAGCVPEAIVFVPATRAAFRRRGFDHMEAVARGLAAYVGLPLADALAKRGRADQREAGRAGRLAQAQGVSQVVRDVRGARLLLIDDVITTGATMNAAAGALVAAGAAQVAGLALARVW